MLFKFKYYPHQALKGGYFVFVSLCVEACGE